jgi:predicted NAD/FAD-dependent oxidoreductase
LDQERRDYVFKLAKRIATLEERVTELENALKKQPADAQMLPTATLRAEYHVTNPRKLIGFRIIVDGKTVAIVSCDEMIKVVLESGLATEFETPDR